MNKFKNFFKFFISKIFLINFAVFIGVLIIIYFGINIGISIYTNHNQEISVPDFSGMTFKEAQKIANEKKLFIQVIDSIYTDKVDKGCIFSQIPEPESNVKEKRTIFLTINSFLSERVHMPDLVGVSIRQAQADAESYGLKIGKLKYVPDIATNNVLHQQFNGKDIKPNELIKKGSTIDLIVGRGLSNEKTYVPNILGLTQQQANEILTKNSLNIGAIIVDTTTIKTIEDSLKSKIYKQYPINRKNAEINLGAFIDIWITNSAELLNNIDTIDHNQDGGPSQKDIIPEGAEENDGE